MNWPECFCCLGMLSLIGFVSYLSYRATMEPEEDE